jgi:hypothetical protein
MADDTSPSSTDEEKFAERITTLIERGLERYGKGDLRGAMNEWEHAMSLKPGDERAREYLDYVQKHFDDLAEQFQEAADIALASAEMDVPFGLEVVGDYDDDAYDLVEVQREEVAGEEDDAAKLAVERYVESVDEGWFLDEIEVEIRADALPPPPEAANGGLADELEAVSAGLLDAGETVAQGETLPAEVAVAPEEPEEEAEAEQVLELEAELPPPDAESFEIEAELPPPDALNLEPPLDERSFELGAELSLSDGEAELDLGEERADEDSDYDDEKTVERGASRPLRPATEEDIDDDEEVTVPGGEEPLPFSQNLGLSEDALAAIRPKTEDGLSTDEPTIERPGIVKRGFALHNLQELDDGMRQDDRVLENGSEPSPVVRVTFRPKTEEGNGDLDEELTTERHASAGLDEELTVERRSDQFPAPAVIVDEALFTEELPTLDAELGGEQPESPPGEIEFVGEPETQEHRREPITITGQSIDESSLARITDEILAELDEGAPEGEPPNERVRRRVSALIKRAESDAGEGRHAIAVATLELASSEAPDSAVAQKVIHRHRDLLLEIYQQYIGDMEAAPALALPMHELSMVELDSRAVFLLSRIDGTISFQEVLDVSGMTHLEAFRHLCRMLVLGILEVQ